MFGDLNKAEIIGNITNELQVRYTGSGTAVTSFSVATNRRYKQEEEWKDDTTFHNVVVWGNQAEQLTQRASKGTRVFVSGRLQTRTWDDNEGKKNYKTEIVADNIILLDRYERGKLDESTKGSKSNFEDTAKKTSQKEDIIDPDDLPF